MGRKRVIIPQEVLTFMDRLNAQYIRTAKHCVMYRLPNGRVVGFPKTTSDRKAVHNFKADCRKALQCG